MSLSKAALRRKTEENPGTKKMARTNADGRTVPASPTTCVFAQCLSPVIYSGFFPGHQLKLLMASLGHFYLHQVEAWPGMCHGCEYPKQGPRRAGKCSENNDTPLLPTLEQGEAAAESIAGAFPFPLMSHWGVLGVISLLFLFSFFLFPLCFSFLFG